MKKFTIICLSVDPPAKESNTWILHIEAKSPDNASFHCGLNHPDFIIVSIFPGWHDEA